MKPSISIFLLFAMLTACATGPQPTSEPAAQQKLAPGIYATDTGEELTEEQLLDRLAEHQYVVVGEQHDDAWHHEIQARVLRGLAERVDEVALGMEMFQRPFQGPLDAYVAGEIDEEQMLEQTEWAERWGFGTEMYRPLWLFAREQAAPIIALNAPRELSRKIAEVGLEGLDEAERSEIPELDLDNQAHRKYVRRAFEQHDMEMSDERFERFYTAQVVWDETMANTAVEFVHNRADVDTMLIVAGGAHAHRGFGIPPRIERRTDADVVTLQPVTDPQSATMEQLGVAADFVWIKE
ncbi:ChaN family lipoprotein [Persicimonas caeni]|uniref:ChaN family lipoprotein n=1 Tax=Persicimonas caeni TaxID=2292766 RepID=A0A4Y6PX43_PERCE|nr:ChaN family lipoprotein [Persicimonas caeni]QDG52587.1 ChaN family lipoprotein [Persicimonas caeni]QED33809.1 ChaN family lipoprotein [Persicimonas caeni]